MQKINLFATMTGSHAYGMNLPTSDIDVRGVYSHDAKTVVTGIDYEPQTKEENEDTVHYELKRFFELLNAQNPNMLEILWASEKTWLYQTNIFEDIQKHKKELLTMNSSKTFLGYAEMQLGRIKGHYKWINNPQTEDPPKISDFIEMVSGNKIPSNENHVAKKLRGSLWGIYEQEGASWIDNKGVPYLGAGKTPVGTPPYIVYINHELYEKSHNQWKQYWTWKENRNVKRSELEEKYGYDTKHASHLIRLLKMGKEILETGEVQVFRKDASELLSIRHGAYTYDQILELTQDLKNEVLKLSNKKLLPETIPSDLLGKLIYESYSKVWDNAIHVSLNRTPEDFLKQNSEKFSENLIDTQGSKIFKI